MSYEEYEFDFLPSIRQRAEALVAKVLSIKILVFALQMSESLPTSLAHAPLMMHMLR